jgi:putative endonuclease
MSQIKGIYYTGSTDDIEERVKLHNSNRAKWTKRYQPWILKHTEEFSTRSEAVKREKFLKSLKNIKKFLDELENKKTKDNLFG